MGGDPDRAGNALRDPLLGAVLGDLARAASPLAPAIACVTLGSIALGGGARFELRDITAPRSAPARSAQPCSALRVSPVRIAGRRVVSPSAPRFSWRFPPTPSSRTERRVPCADPDPLRKPHFGDLHATPRCPSMPPRRRPRDAARCIPLRARRGGGNPPVRRERRGSAHRPPGTAARLRGRHRSRRAARRDALCTQSGSTVTDSLVASSIVAGRLLAYYAVKAAACERRRPAPLRGSAARRARTAAPPPPCWKEIRRRPRAPTIAPPPAASRASSATNGAAPGRKT